MKFEEKVLSSQVVYQGKIIRVEKAQVLTPKNQHAQRDIVKHSPAIAILMIDDHDRIILVQQWRTAANKITLEIPAGKIDDRDDGNAVHAVKREMNEETRLEADNIQIINSSFSSPGFTDEKISLYLATDLHNVSKELPQDADEELSLVRLSFQDAVEMITDGKIDDMKTVMAIYYWGMKRSEA